MERKATAFVSKLYSMLQDVRNQDIIWWETDYVFALKANNSKFVELLQSYFKHGNVSSFVRQLHMYGFRKMFDNTSHENKTVYYGEEDELVWKFKHSANLFKKNDESNLYLIRRRTTKPRRDSSDSNQSHSHSPPPAPGAGPTSGPAPGPASAPTPAPAPPTTQVNPAFQHSHQPSLQLQIPPPQRSIPLQQIIHPISPPYGAVYQANDNGITRYYNAHYQEILYQPFIQQASPPLTGVSSPATSVPVPVARPQPTSRPQPQPQQQPQPRSQPTPRPQAQPRPQAPSTAPSPAAQPSISPSAGYFPQLQPGQSYYIKVTIQADGSEIHTPLLDTLTPAVSTPGLMPAPVLAPQPQPQQLHPTQHQQHPPQYAHSPQHKQQHPPQYAHSPQSAQQHENEGPIPSISTLMGHHRHTSSVSSLANAGYVPSHSHSRSSSISKRTYSSTDMSVGSLIDKRRR